MTHDKFCDGTTIVNKHADAPPDFLEENVKFFCNCDTLQIVRQDEREKVAQEIENSPINSIYYSPHEVHNICAQIARAT